jgi:hypothetical protein
MKTRVKVWTQDQKHLEQVLLQAQPHASTETNYTANDFLLEFFKENGLWDSMVGSRPKKLKQDNGYPWKILQQIGILHELAQAGRLIKIFPLISDHCCPNVNRIKTAA